MFRMTNSNSLRSVVVLLALSLTYQQTASLLAPATRAEVTNWSGANNLSFARHSHTATVLANGKILVAGGRAGNGAPIASAELYDPATGLWTTTGSLNDARHDHTATLLPNGQVLVVGGLSSSNLLKSAELYDPITRLWTRAGNLNDGRNNHTATLLPSGCVLIAGGEDRDKKSLQTAELYDPATGVWAPTNSLSGERTRHTATLLSNGKVLVAGGLANPITLRSAELYDPATSTWSAADFFGVARRDHTATLLPNGKVLIAGGRTGTGAPVANAELYDPANGGWTPTGGLNIARSDHTAIVLPSGQVLATGQLDETGTSTPSAELYDPNTGVWTMANNPSVLRYQHTATLLADGRVIIAGGNSDAFTALNSTQFYGPGPSGALITFTGSLNHPRSNHTATLLPNGKVLVTGGFIRPFTMPAPLVTSELYDYTKGTWADTGNLNLSRFNHTATLLANGKVLVAGGTGRNSAELYDPVTGVWTPTGNLNEVRASHTATLLSNGKVLVVGGSNGSTVLASAELYDPATGVWTTTGSLAAARANHTATLLPDGRVMVAGGQSGNVASASTELYNPGAGTWSSAGNLAAARFNHTALLQANGRVMVAGGQSGSSTYLSSAEAYDTSSGWIGTAGLATASSRLTATALQNGKVIFAGGYQGSALNATTLLDLGSSSAPSSNMATARFFHTATLLPNGKVLFAGGQSDSNFLNSAELHNPWFFFADPQWRPALTRVSSPVAPDGPLSATGSFFKGIGEASGGNGNQNSATNTPVLQLRRLDNGQTATLLANPAGWSNTVFNATVPAGFNLGPVLLTVFTNGIPSLQRMTVVQDTALTPTSQSFAPNGGTDSFVLTTPQSVVGWTATSDAPWLHITSPTVGTGSATISYLVEFHTSTAPRSGTITVAGQTFTVLQGGNFADVSQADPLYSFIGKLSARGITQGCGGGNYCPNAPVTRAQMAVFIERAARGGSFVPPAAQCVNGHTANFTDVPCPNLFADFIEQLRADEITLGCGMGVYCPNDAVTRAQMAIFIERALGNFTPPLALAQRFADVPPGHVAFPFVADMAARAITLGCGGNLYCPNDAVTRGQMAAFLVRAFGL
jgi:hypothetical protein